MPDRTDEAVALAREARERATEREVRATLAVDVRGDHRVDPPAGTEQAREPALLERLAEVHEAPAAPGADRGGGRVHARHKPNRARGLWRPSIGFARADGERHTGPRPAALSCPELSAKGSHGGLLRAPADGGRVGGAPAQCRLQSL